MTVANPDAIQAEFKKKVSDKISLLPEGSNRFRVFTPFQFDDQDHLGIILKRVGDEWVLSDEGNTFMHLTYDLNESDFDKGNRAEIIEESLSTFSVQNRQGELVIPVRDGHFGDALYDFIQAVLRINDISFLSRERVQTTFVEDFRSLISKKVPTGRRHFQWSDPARDPSKKYIVDCRINGMARPLFLFALNSDQQVRDATITLLQFEAWQVAFRSIGIFEKQEEIGRLVLARFSDHCDKQFSNLTENTFRISKYIDDAIS